MSKRRKEPASQLDAWEAQWNREEPAEMRQIREHEERKYGKRPSDPAARAQYDKLLSGVHSAGQWLLVVALVLGFFLFMALVALGDEKGWFASGGDCAEYYDACVTEPSYDPYGYSSYD